MNKIMTSMERWWMEKLAFTYQTWFTSPYPARKILAKFVRFQVPKLLRKDISQWRKGPTKNLLYSLECLLQKKKNGTVCKGLLTSKHLEISSSKKILTAVQWTPSWCMKRNESEIVKALTNFPFCSFVCCLIWPPGASSPCISKHLEISSSKKNITAVQWTTSFTSCQASFAFASPPFDALNSGDFVRFEGQNSLKKYNFA